MQRSHYIKQKLGLYWSPEQVSGRLCMEDNIHISTETIYRMMADSTHKRNTGSKKTVVTYPLSKDLEKGLIKSIF